MSETPSVEHASLPLSPTQSGHPPFPAPAPPAAEVTAEATAETHPEEPQGHVPRRPSALLPGAIGGCTLRRSICDAADVSVRPPQWAPRSPAVPAAAPPRPTPTPFTASADEDPQLATTVGSDGRGSAPSHRQSFGDADYARSLTIGAPRMSLSAEPGVVVSGAAGEGPPMFAFGDAHIVTPPTPFAGRGPALHTNATPASGPLLAVQPPPSPLVGRGGPPVHQRGGLLSTGGPEGMGASMPATPMSTFAVTPMPLREVLVGGGPGLGRRHSSLSTGAGTPSPGRTPFESVSRRSSLSPGLSVSTASFRRDSLPPKAQPVAAAEQKEKPHPWWKHPPRYSIVRQEQYAERLERERRERGEASTDGPRGASPVASPAGRDSLDDPNRTPEVRHTMLTAASPVTSAIPAPHAPPLRLEHSPHRGAYLMHDGISVASSVSRASPVHQPSPVPHHLHHAAPFAETPDPAVSPHQCPTPQGPDDHQSDGTTSYGGVPVYYCPPPPSEAEYAAVAERCALYGPLPQPPQLPLVDVVLSAQLTAGGWLHHRQRGPRSTENPYRAVLPAVTRHGVPLRTTADVERLERHFRRAAAAEEAREAEEVLLWHLAECPDDEASIVRGVVLSTECLVRGIVARQESDARLRLLADAGAEVALSTATAQQQALCAEEAAVRSEEVEADERDMRFLVEGAASEPWARRQVARRADEALAVLQAEFDAADSEARAVWATTPLALLATEGIETVTGFAEDSLAALEHMATVAHGGALVAMAERLRRHAILEEFSALMTCLTFDVRTLGIAATTGAWPVIDLTVIDPVPVPLREDGELTPALPSGASSVTAVGALEGTVYASTVRASDLNTVWEESRSTLAGSRGLSTRAGSAASHSTFASTLGSEATSLGAVPRAHGGGQPMGALVPSPGMGGSDSDGSGGGSPPALPLADPGSPDDRSPGGDSVRGVCGEEEMLSPGREASALPLELRSDDDAVLPYASPALGDAAGGLSPLDLRSPLPERRRKEDPIKALYPLAYAALTGALFRKTRPGVHFADGTEPAAPALTTAQRWVNIIALRARLQSSGEPCDRRDLFAVEFAARQRLLLTFEALQRATVCEAEATARGGTHLSWHHRFLREQRALQLHATKRRLRCLEDGDAELSAAAAPLRDAVAAEEEAAWVTLVGAHRHRAQALLLQQWETGRRAAIADHAAGIAAAARWTVKEVRLWMPRWEDTDVGREAQRLQLHEAMCRGVVWDEERAAADAARANLRLLGDVLAWHGAAHRELQHHGRRAELAMAEARERDEILRDEALFHSCLHRPVAALGDLSLTVPVLEALAPEDDEGFTDLGLAAAWLDLVAAVA